MPVNWCDLCSDECLKGQIGATPGMDQLWRTLVAQALCAIAQASGGGGGNPLDSVFVEEDATFTETNAGIDILPATDNGYKWLRFEGDINADIQLKFGTTNILTIKPGEVKDIPLAANGLRAIGVIHLSSSGATSGSIRVTGGHT